MFKCKHLIIKLLSFTLQLGNSLRTLKTFSQEPDYPDYRVSKSPRLQGQHTFISKTIKPSKRVFQYGHGLRSIPLIVQFLFSVHQFLYFCQLKNLHAVLAMDNHWTYIIDLVQKWQQTALFNTPIIFSNCASTIFSIPVLLLF